MDHAHQRRIDAAIQRAIDKRRLLALGAAPVTRPKLFLCGHEYAGKTTLAAALGRSWWGSVVAGEGRKARLDNPESRTLGVAVSDLVLDGAEFNLWDFAGLEEYHPTHEFLLTDRRAIFVVVCSLRLPAAERHQQLLYWLRFIATRFAPQPDDAVATSPASIPEVPEVVVGQPPEGQQSQAEGQPPTPRHLGHLPSAGQNPYLLAPQLPPA